MLNFVVSLIISAVVIWTIITSVAFFQFTDLECIRYSDWQKVSDMKQERICLLYQPITKAGRE